jgi:hypothetical protein
MRVVIHEYPQGGRTAYELSNDGGDFLGDWDGQRQVGGRICAFIDAGCDDTEAGVKRLLDTLAWLADEIKKRKLSAPSAAASANGPQQP